MTPPKNKKNHKFEQENPLLDSLLEGWARVLELRHIETASHAKRVAQNAEKLALLLNLDDIEIINIKRGALLHDIGKIGIPDSILLKKGRLSQEEWKVMKKHPEYAFDIVSPVKNLAPALDIPLFHHEKWDGTGYPNGLKGKEIPLFARIFSIIDVWDALESDRPYRKAWNRKKITSHVISLSGNHFDPKILRVFIKNRHKILS